MALRVLDDNDHPEVVKPRPVSKTRACPTIAEVGLQLADESGLAVPVIALPRFLDFEEEVVGACAVRVARVRDAEDGVRVDGASQIPSAPVQLQAVSGTALLEGDVELGDLVLMPKRVGTFLVVEFPPAVVKIVLSGESESGAGKPVHVLIAPEAVVAIVLSERSTSQVSPQGEIPEDSSRRAFNGCLGFHVGGIERLEQTVEVGRLEVSLFDKQPENLFSRPRQSKRLRRLSLRS
ncbi:MAG: hypothetical protein HYX76_15950 [Acidobacteria bacterium]|nr:hypothetical protein [Acidobacteriota bacterium]